jgi:hypothetical protein
MWGIFEIEYIIQFIGFYGNTPMVYPKLGSLCEQEWTWRNIITTHKCGFSGRNWVWMDIGSKKEKTIQV